MGSRELEVVGFDSYGGKDFVIYFSDDTFATVTAAALAKCFPDRIPLPPPDLGLTIVPGRT
jgi:hypothetical protein